MTTLRELFRKGLTGWLRRDGDAAPEMPPVAGEAGDTPAMPESIAIDVKELPASAHQHAQAVRGNPQALRTRLAWLVRMVGLSHPTNELQLDQKRAAIRAEITELEGQAAELRRKLEELETENEQARSRLERETGLSQEGTAGRGGASPAPVDAAPGDPAAPSGGDSRESRSWLTIAVNSTLLGVLTFFLVVVYISIGHLAFFREVISEFRENGGTQDLGNLLSSLFDVHSLPIAIRERNLFLLAFPGVFLSLGYLVHRMFARRAWWLLGGFLLVTLALDLTLAYQVSASTYRLRALVQNMPAWQPRMAFTDVNTYTVLLSGFMCYLVWSFLYGFLHQDLDRRAPETARARERRIAEEKRSEAMKRIEEAMDEKRKHLGHELHEVEAKVADRRRKLAGIDASPAVRWIDPTWIQVALDSYLSGWEEALATMYRDPKELDARITEAHQVRGEFGAGEVRKLMVDSRRQIDARDRSGDPPEEIGVAS